MAATDKLAQILQLLLDNPRLKEIFLDVTFHQPGAGSGGGHSGIWIVGLVVVGIAVVAATWTVARR